MVFVETQLVAAFGVIGGGIKAVDDSFDESRFDERIAVGLAVAIGCLAGYAALTDRVAATLLLSIFVGTLLAGKVDNVGHVVAGLLLAGVVGVLGDGVLLWPFLLLTLTTLVDELGHTLSDTYLRGRTRPDTMSRVLIVFFEYRCTLKLVVLASVVSETVPPWTLLALLLFDIAYELVGAVDR